MAQCFALGYSPQAGTLAVAVDTSTAPSASPGHVSCLTLHAPAHQHANSEQIVRAGMQQHCTLCLGLPQQSRVTGPPLALQSNARSEGQCCTICVGRLCQPPFCHAPAHMQARSEQHLTNRRNSTNPLSLSLPPTWRPPLHMHLLHPVSSTL